MAELTLVGVDPHLCVLCDKPAKTSHDMLVHLLSSHREHDAMDQTWKFNCQCGSSFSITLRDAEYGRIDNIISALKTHMTGRIGCGVTTPNITLEEIRDHLWTAYHMRSLGVTP